MSEWVSEENKRLHYTSDDEPASPHFRNWLLSLATFFFITSFLLLLNSRASKMCLVVNKTREMYTKYRWSLINFTNCLHIQQWALLEGQQAVIKWVARESDLYIQMFYGRRSYKKMSVLYGLTCRCCFFSSVKLWQGKGGTFHIYIHIKGNQHTISKCNKIRCMFSSTCSRNKTKKL